MDTKQCIQKLNDILNTFPVTNEQKQAIETAIKKLESGNTISIIIDVVKILANLLNAGTKIFDP